MSEVKHTGALMSDCGVVHYLSFYAFILFLLCFYQIHLSSYLGLTQPPSSKAPRSPTHRNWKKQKGTHIRVTIILRRGLVWRESSQTMASVLRMPWWHPQSSTSISFPFLFRV